MGENTVEESTIYLQSTQQDLTNLLRICLVTKIKDIEKKLRPEKKSQISEVAKWSHLNSGSF
jgi:hypothetical protein